MNQGLGEAERVCLNRPGIERLRDTWIQTLHFLLQTLGLSINPNSTLSTTNTASIPSLDSCLDPPTATSSLVCGLMTVTSFTDFPSSPGGGGACMDSFRRCCKAFTPFFLYFLASFWTKGTKDTQSSVIILRKQSKSYNNMAHSPKPNIT